MGRGIAQDIGDHPVIRNMERSGTPDGKPTHYPRCPMCGEETDSYYITACGVVVGCDNCLREVDAWDY